MRLLLAAAISLLPSLAAAGDLEVAVTGVRNANGTIRVALCTEKTFLGFDCAYKGAVPAKAGTTLVRIEGVAAGVYAAEAFHDEDNSGKLETSFFGLPKKGMGFSRDAKMSYGPPKFAEAAVQVTAAGGRIDLPLHYP